jgi:hypothetical protein
MLRSLSQEEREVMSYVLRYAFINPSNVNLEDGEISTIRNLYEIVNNGGFRIDSLREGVKIYAQRNMF